MKSDQEFIRGIYEKAQKQQQMQRQACEPEGFLFPVLPVRFMKAAMVGCCAVVLSVVCGSVTSLSQHPVEPQNEAAPAAYAREIPQATGNADAFRLQQEAEAIVVGKVEDVVLSQDRATLKLEVERVYQGTASDSIEVSVWDNGAMGAFRGQTVLCFLKKNMDSQSPEYLLMETTQGVACYPVAYQEGDMVVSYLPDGKFLVYPPVGAIQME